MKKLIKQWVLSYQKKRAVKRLTSVRKLLVFRMRANGFSWTKINQVLYALGQQQILLVERLDNGLVRFKWQSNLNKGHTPQIISKQAADFQ